MGKAAIVTDAITIVGIIAISTLLFVQIPGMINDIKIVLEKESASAKSKELSTLITIANSAPNEIKITYNLPEMADVSVKDNLLTVSAKETASYKILSNLEDFSKEDINSLTITKTIEAEETFVEVS